ncbi:MAG: hypothetical protein ACRD3C_22595 [Vicinamibacterales bacterium]
MGNERWPTLQAHVLALAEQFPVALGQRVLMGQIVLKFTNGVLSDKERPRVAALAVALRDTFGRPMFEEELALNFVNGILQSLERKTRHSGSIETREFFRVRRHNEKPLARG